MNELRTEKTLQWRRVNTKVTKTEHENKENLKLRTLQ
jgi:hypothetical protein